MSDREQQRREQQAVLANAYQTVEAATDQLIANFGTHDQAQREALKEVQATLRMARKQAQLRSECTHRAVEAGSNRCLDCGDLAF